MEQTLQRILAGVYVLIGLVGVLVIPLVYIILSQLDRRGGNVPINVFQTVLRVFGLVGKTAKRRFSLRVTKQKLKNLGDTPVIPDVDDAVFKKFVRDLWREVDGTDNIEGVELTEAVWLPKFDGSPAQFRICMERLEQKGITRRKDGRGTRGWWKSPNGSYAGARERLKQLAGGS